MSFRLEIRPAADRDISAAAEYLAGESVEAALRFLDRVGETLGLIREGPRRWAEYPMADARLAGLRRRSVVGFPRYLVFYLVEDELVDVLRVLHSARDIALVLRVEVEGEG